MAHPMIILFGILFAELFALAILAPDLADLTIFTLAFWIATVMIFIGIGV